MIMRIIRWIISFFTRHKKGVIVGAAAIGGAGALLSKAIDDSSVVAYEDLGAEAIRELKVTNFPAIVVIDSQGNNLYETAIKEYCQE